MTLELVTKGVVYPKCQLLGIEAGAMVYARDQLSGVVTKGIAQTRCLLVTKEEIATAVSDELSTAHGTGSWKTGTGGTGGGGGGGAIIERPSIWKLEEKLKLIEDIKKMHKMMNEFGSLQSVGLQNIKKNIDDFKSSLLRLIKEEVTILITLKKTIAERPQKTESSDALSDTLTQIIAKWDAIQKSIIKSSDLSTLDHKLDDIVKIMAKSLSNKDLEDLVKNGN